MARLASFVLLVLAAFAAAADHVPPHMRKEGRNSPPLRWKKSISTTLDFNAGEIRAELGEYIYTAFVLDRTVKSASEPDSFSYNADSTNGKMTVGIAKYEAPSYEAAVGVPAKWKPAGEFRINGQPCPFYLESPGPAWRALYADPAARDKKPFVYYSLQISGTRGARDKRSLRELEDLLSSLVIRTPGLEAPSTAGRCLPFAG